MIKYISSLVILGSLGTLLAMQTPEQCMQSDDAKKKYAELKDYVTLDREAFSNKYPKKRYVSELGYVHDLQKSNAGQCVTDKIAQEEKARLLPEVENLIKKGSFLGGLKHGKLSPNEWRRADNFLDIIKYGTIMRGPKEESFREAPQYQKLRKALDDLQEKVLPKKKVHPQSSSSSIYTGYQTLG